MDNGANNCMGYAPQGTLTNGINNWWYRSDPVTVCWEYQELPQSHEHGENLRALNEAGAAGWDLCHVGHQHYLMKRMSYRQATTPTQAAQSASADPSD